MRFAGRCSKATRQSAIDASERKSCEHGRAKGEASSNRIVQAATRALRLRARRWVCTRGCVRRRKIESRIAGSEGEGDKGKTTQGSQKPDAYDLGRH